MTVLLTLFLAFFKVGAFSFGGGYAMLPLIQREVIEAHQWITPHQFVDIVAISQVTPGPIAINMATYVGRDVYGVPGAIVATAAVVAPSVIIVTSLAHLFLKFRTMATLQAILAGIRPAVVALLVLAAFSIARSAVPDWRSAVLAVASLVTIRLTRLSPLLVLALSGLAGVLIFRG